MKRKATREFFFKTSCIQTKKIQQYEKDKRLFCLAYPPLMPPGQTSFKIRNCFLPLLTTKNSFLGKAKLNWFNVEPIL